MFTSEEFQSAHAVVGAVVEPTPARQWPLLAEKVGTSVVVKHENHAPTGAFKVRGGLVYMDRLKRERPHIQNVVAATTGNHGQSIALAGTHAGLGVRIVVPYGNSKEKNAAMRAFGANLIEHGSDFQEAYDHARTLCEDESVEMVPSYHRDLVLGVSTYALELLSQHPDLDVLYVPVGLGSGICGCVAARDCLGAKTRIVGVQAEGAPSYVLSFEQSRSVSTNAADTFAEGIATRVPDEEALEVILKGVESIVTVSDDEIAEAIRLYWSCTHNLAEGAGASPLAAAIKERDQNQGRNVGLVLSGGNIDFELFHRHVLGRVPREQGAGQ